MQRRIVGFAVDDVGDRVALLDCLHRQHIRHQPPFRSAAWIEDDDERARRVGTPWPCPLCDRCELPPDLAVVRTTATWDEHTMPAALRAAHRVAPGRWGRILVAAGALRFVAETEPVTDVVVVAPGQQPIPPDVAHHVEPGPGTRFAVEFLGRRPGPVPPVT